MRKITEQELVSEFVFAVAKTAEDSWPAMHKELSTSWGNKFDIKDEAAAEYFFVIASISLSVKLLKDIIIAEGKQVQADRIYEWALSSLNDSEDGHYVKDSIEKYQKLFVKHNLTKDNIIELLDTVVIKLLHQWLGESFEKNFVVKKNSAVVIVSPLILGQIRHFLILLISPVKVVWETIKETTTR